jgi:hypothetical protein
MQALKKSPDRSRGQGGGSRKGSALGMDQKPLPEEAFNIARYRRSEVCAGPSDGGDIACGWFCRPDSRGEHGGNHDAHCCRLHVHGALLFDEDRLNIRRGSTRSTVTDITRLSIGASLPVATDPAAGVAMVIFSLAANATQPPAFFCLFNFSKTRRPQLGAQQP